MKKANVIITLENAQKYTGIHYTINHNGKMSGIASLSTSVTVNERCKVNAQVPGSICSKCFAAKQMEHFTSMEKPLVKNKEILTGSILPDDMLPLINRLYFRFESFGDLNNAIQVINYFNICKKNPGVNFALWTKNPDYIQQAIEMGHSKPENLNIILSSLFINKERVNTYTFIDKVFTVYDPKYAAENGIEINCGARSCLTCRRCYEKNDITVVNELLK